MEIDIYCANCACTMNETVDRYNNVIVQCTACDSEHEDKIKKLKAEIERLEYRIDELETFVDDYISDENDVDTPKV